MTTNVEQQIHSKVQLIVLQQAAVTPSNQLTFQCEYTRLRLLMLQAHLKLIETCQLAETHPQPAILNLNTVVGNSRTDNNIIVTQVRIMLGAAVILLNWRGATLASPFFMLTSDFCR